MTRLSGADARPLLAERRSVPRLRLGSCALHDSISSGGCWRTSGTMQDRRMEAVKCHRRLLAQLVPSAAVVGMIHADRRYAAHSMIGEMRSKEACSAMIV
jgi:hypothetical protein